jgi:hypothetical protein
MAIGHVRQDRRVLFQSSHDISKFQRLWLSIALLSADSQPARIHEFRAFSAIIASIAGYCPYQPRK